MFVELIYDKRNVAGLPNAQELILTELTKRIQRVFPEAEVKVKPMQANGVKTDASKSDKSVMLRIIEEMFDEADQWLISEEF
ncbi:DinI-like family protein [Erwinia sp. P7711]|jgi:GMP synthase PP-ATPase subunit|uniref:DinI-like family protein n=1 Tax=Erwinia pyri TaxID=3062598 RepID=A0AA50DM78_9GAMM|nr:DinI-like family protein [Erwinia sp. DE2]WLS80499.1 DinI-like family protein [Erwinia sp. DE2]